MFFIFKSNLSIYITPSKTYINTFKMGRKKTSPGKLDMQKNY